MELAPLAALWDRQDEPRRAAYAYRRALEATGRVERQTTPVTEH